MDLANIHRPISKSPPVEDADFELSTEQIAFYVEHGYLAGVRVLSDERLDALRAELTEMMMPGHRGGDLWYEYHSNESADPDTILFHALGAWRIGKAFHDLLWNPAVTVPAKQLLGGAVRFWHDQLFCKPAQHGGVVAWHQDYSYWTRTEPMAHLTCWIGLDDSTRENGCVCYVPGSHRWPLLPVTGLAGDMGAIQQVLTPEQWRTFNNPLPIELKAGECVFHHPLMVHGSMQNRSDKSRRATVINLVKDGVRSATDDPLLANVPAVPRGEMLSGTYFPLLRS